MTGVHRWPGSGAAESPSVCRWSLACPYLWWATEKPAIGLITRALSGAASDYIAVYFQRSRELAEAENGRGNISRTHAGDDSHGMSGTAVQARWIADPNRPMLAGG